MWGHKLNCEDCVFCEVTKPVYSKWGELLEPSYRECTGESSEEDWNEYFASQHDFPEDYIPPCFSEPHWYPEDWD